eukprot:3688278-Ditylum_brightwellii.AAC.1
MMKVSATVYSNQASLKIIESDLNSVTQTAENHVQNNNAITSNFDEKLNKVILDTEQVAMDLSKACNKATLLKFQASDSRLDDIDKTLHGHDEELQVMK